MHKYVGTTVCIMLSQLFKPYYYKTDGKTPSDDKSLHGIWPSQLKTNW